MAIKKVPTHRLITHENRTFDLLDTEASTDSMNITACMILRKVVTLFIFLVLNSIKIKLLRMYAWDGMFST